MGSTFGQDLIASMEEAVADAQGKRGVARVHRGASLDSEGVLPEFQARAIKEVVAWQHEEVGVDPQD